MLNVYVICNNALVHKQYVIANSTERVHTHMKMYNRCTLFSTLSVTYRVNQFHKTEYSVSEFRVIVIMIIWWLTYFLNSD